MLRPIGISVMTLVMLLGCQSTADTPATEMSSAMRLSVFKDGRALSLKLAEEEAETYSGSYISDVSCNCRIFLFANVTDETAHATLGRYTQSPHFSAELTKYTLQELRDAKQQAAALIGQEYKSLQSVTHLEVSENLNVVLLHITSEAPQVSKALTELRPKLHPAIAMVYDEDIGVIEVY